jgi:hypothetical protein
VCRSGWGRGLLLLLCARVPVVAGVRRPAGVRAFCRVPGPVWSVKSSRKPGHRVVWGDPCSTSRTGPRMPGVRRQGGPAGRVHPADAHPQAGSGAAGCVVPVLRVRQGGARWHRGPGARGLQDGDRLRARDRRRWHINIGAVTNGGMSTFALTNPSTGETEQTFTRLDDSERDAVLTRASDAFTRWRETDIDERAAVLRRAADLYKERSDELASYIGREMGKLSRWGEGGDRHRLRHLPLVRRPRPRAARRP